MEPAAVLKLSKPFEFGGDTIVQLEFREAVGGDLMHLPAGEPSTGDFLLMGAALCNQAPALLKALPIVDALRVVEVVSGFFGDGPETGDKSPPS